MTELWLSSEDTGAYGRDLYSATDTTDTRPGLTRLLDALLPVLPPGVSQSPACRMAVCCMYVYVCWITNRLIRHELHSSTGDAPAGHDQSPLHSRPIGGGGKCDEAPQRVQLLARAGAVGVGQGMCVLWTMCFRLMGRREGSSLPFMVTLAAPLHPLEPHSLSHVMHASTPPNATTTTTVHAKVLSAMNREYTVAEFRRVVGFLQEHVPGVTIATVRPRLFCCF